jgi:hypothetical protein
VDLTTFVFTIFLKSPKIRKVSISEHRNLNGKSILFLGLPFFLATHWREMKQNGGLARFLAPEMTVSKATQYAELP